MIAVAERRERSTEGTGGHSGRRLPAVPLLLCCAAVGFLVCVAANALSRATLAPPPALFWAGLLLAVAPIVYRLTSLAPSARERLFLVCLLGLTLYGVKLARDPTMFTYPDELVHAYNALTIVRTGELFGFNPILPATPYYPGLEGATSALATTGGASVFTAGVVLVAFARLLAVVALFLLFQVVSGSPRAAGIGVAAYTANANFLYFNVQYSYESLSLPLLVGVLAAVAHWQRTRLRGWWLPIGLGIAAVVVTHHLTSYALAGALVGLSVIHLAVRRRHAAPNPWPFAALAVALAVCWGVLVGSAVVDYLGPVVDRAVRGVQDTVTGEAAPRQLFESKPTDVAATAAPGVERLLSLLAVPVFAIVVALGLRQIWRRHRFDPVAILLALAAIAYFGTLGLRLAPQAWEIGNRASAFLFVGLGFVVGCSRLETWRPRWAPRLGRIVLTGGLALGLVGGVVAGWPADIRLSQPLVVKADGQEIESEPLGAARWLSSAVPGSRVAATVGDARLALVHGRVLALAGATPDIQDMLLLPKMDQWMLDILRDYDLRYVIADRRFRARDISRAPYFAVRPPLGAPEILLPPGVVDKFEDHGGFRVLDSGHIVVFDMQGGR